MAAGAKGNRAWSKDVTKYLIPGLLVAAIAELASIIWVGQHVGVISTIALLAIGGFAGLSVIKTAGLSLAETLQRPPRDLHFASLTAAGRFLALLAGLLLIIPGFISDLLALALLIPPVQAALAGRLASKVQVHAARWQADPAPRQGPLVIEGEAVEIKPPGDRP